MVELTIEALDEDGRGVGVGPDGRRWHVAGALPGERVRARAEHRSPHAPRTWAELVGVVGAPSPDRVTPACPGFGRCGGCTLQHLHYPAQLAAKQARLERVLGRPVEAVVPSPAELGYRNKAKYVLGPAALPGEPVRRGSFAPASHLLVDMAGCRVPEPPIDEVAGELCAALAATGLAVYDERDGSGELRHLVLRANHAGALLALLVTRTGAGEEALAEAARAVRARRPELAGVVRQVNPSRGGGILGGDERLLDGATELADEIGGVALLLSASAFFQVNRAQAARLYAHVAGECGGGARVVDLYCGVGGIALTVAAASADAHVLGVENHVGAVDDARRSAAAAGLAVRARFLHADAAEGLREATMLLGGVDTVVVNPPRKGLSAAARAALVEGAPPRLVYVSCGPESLARDLAALEAAGYAVARVAPFDLMPGTPQVETVVTLSRH